MGLSKEASTVPTPIRRPVLFVQRLLSLQFVRFLLVGGLNTLFGYGLFAGLYIFSHQRQGSLVVATVIGAVFNFFTTGRLVFANRGYRMLIPFVLGYAVVLGANMVLLEVLARLGAPTLIAQAIALPAMVVLSYLINRYAVFADAGRQRRKP
jgi:putative flippase GtrA